MGKINSKQKGARGEREWVDFCKKRGWKDSRRTQQFNGATEEGDADTIGLPDIWVEVKRVEKLNLSKAMEQAVHDCREGFPIVAHRKNGETWKVTMEANDWFVLYNFYQGRGRHR